ncbi:Pre-mRNA-splicing factor of RES complex-domain-containing protein [Apiosordaria backusii]|uniref:Pre-mRNA-splicing factor of RES complex-domain-containing protein n=1 Tax=Apiosordaria backusii TaxID=314023 RepID=A0AA40BKL4_9PEZI|nr:Pre-mRNA-splicing factor of RES complex-domain-containing protein [Apiosordaria backusii]
MPTDKASYLATHYLTADPPKSSSSSSSSKKRKRSSKSKPPTAAAVNNLIIQDDEDSWATPTNQQSEDEDGDTPMIIAGHTAEFRRTKKSAWNTVGTATLPVKKPPPPPPTDDAGDVADAVLAAAKSDAAALGHDSDDDSSSEDEQQIKMSNGMKPGLQSASSITAQLAAKAAEEKAELARLQQQLASTPKNDDEDEVILRDATGRRIDVSLRRAQARKQLLEAERAEAEKQRLLKGDVQVKEAERKREKLEEAKLMKVARGRDDEEMNRELREEGRWNDPMAEFLTETTTDKGRKRKKMMRGRPVYNGPAEPNRYGIRPGYRWDGVDRGNGWERERFRVLNRKEMVRGLEYAWQMDE